VVVTKDRVHGGPDLDELDRLGLGGLDLDRLLDFSVNVSPYGRLPALDRAVREARLDRYPDPGARAARRALAAAWGVSADRVAIGNGAAELLFTLVQLLAGAGKTLLTVEPTFSEPAVAVRAAGGRLASWRASEADGFQVDVNAVSEAARACGATAVYLCNPGNPTGRALPIAAVAALAEALAPRDVTLIVDEAFVSLSTRAADAERPLPGAVVRVRSFTKDHGVPGLRLGALLGPAPLVARLEAARPTWTVGAAAQAALVVCAGAAARAHAADVFARWRADTLALATGLAALDIPVLPGDSVYLLARVGDAAVLRRRLLVDHQILVRDCTSFGLPAYIRLAGRPAPDRQRLLAALAPGPR
jgi:histidinol-phosphate/aromatic aminotransferase/cobyric acid decarboxylase-like protein